MRSSDLLTDVRRAMGAPNYQARFSTQDVLDIASSQQMNYVVPEIKSLRKDFFVAEKNFSLAVGDDTLAIPERAVGRGIRDLWFTEKANPTPGDWKELVYVDLSDILGLSTSVGNTFAYYFQDDDLKFYPQLAVAATLKLFYYYRPAAIVEESKTCTILSIGTDTLTVDEVPSNIQLGSIIDVIKVRPSFRTLAESYTVTARASNSITCAGVDFSTMKIAAGDIVSLERQTSVIQLPEDAHELLVWATANEMATSIGIEDMIKNTEKQMTGALAGMRLALTPRTEDSQTIINSSSLLRAGFANIASIMR